MKYYLYHNGVPITDKSGKPVEVKPHTIEVTPDADELTKQSPDWDNIIDHIKEQYPQPMTDKEIYQQTLLNRLDAITESLDRKNAEYASDNTPYHNFDTAGDMDSITPEEALWGMVLKQIVSVRDMVKGGKVTPYLVNEKIGDVVNYMILLEGLLIRKLRDGEANDI